MDRTPQQILLYSWLLTQQPIREEIPEHDRLDDVLVGALIGAAIIGALMVVGVF